MVSGSFLAPSRRRPGGWSGWRRSPYHELG